MPITTAEKLETMLAQIDPAGFRVHPARRFMMLACHDATDGLGLKEFSEWCRRDAQCTWTAADIAHKWDGAADRAAPEGKRRIDWRHLEDVCRRRGVEFLYSDASDDFDEVEGGPETVPLTPGERRRATRDAARAARSAAPQAPPGGTQQPEEEKRLTRRQRLAKDRLLMTAKNSIR